MDAPIAGAVVTNEKFEVSKILVAKAGIGCVNQNNQGYGRHSGRGIQDQCGHRERCGLQMYGLVFRD